ncbi:hypothetical protein L6452_39204 [Arctium lappa]|uniref:Uncharacterized protein n=1 Tax=Arctium lappa TaxID=4217 RepID=A0ACB8XS43_ARCLA|nr:hypothetical protein L6452_39204 [Arctium lappa]
MSTKRSHLRFRFTSNQRFNNYFLPFFLLFITLSLIFFLALRSSSPHTISKTLSKPNSISHTLNNLPEVHRFAYFNGDRLDRLIRAVYHPRNYYLLHLELEASDAERLDIAKNVKVLKNVIVVGKANLVTSKGPTIIACMLHIVALLIILKMEPSVIKFSEDQITQLLSAFWIQAKLLDNSLQISRL